MPAKVGRMVKNCDLRLENDALGHSFSPSGPPSQQIIYIYYMASSASGQDEPNRTLWVATRAFKMEPSCPLGTTRCILHEKFPRKPYNKAVIDQVCSVKMVGYWPRSFFCEFMKHAKKELGQYPAILTSHLVNNPYVWVHYTAIFSRKALETSLGCFGISLRHRPLYHINKGT